MISNDCKAPRQRATATVRLVACLFVVTIIISTGCRIVVHPTLGGRVESSSGKYICKSACRIDINDITFDEEFVAKPKETKNAKGKNVFVKWADDGLCANKRDPCRIDSSWAQLHPLFLEILLSDEVYKLEAIFDSPEMLTAAVLPVRRTVQAGETAYAKLYMWTGWTGVFMGTTLSRKCPANTICDIEVGRQNQPGCTGGKVCYEGEHVRDITILTTAETPKGVHPICVDFEHVVSPIIAKPIKRYGTCVYLTVI
jgi:hypothetical protein